MKNMKLLGALLVMSSLSVGCQGKKGDRGSDGGGRVIATLNCAGPISGLSGGAAPLNGINIEYNAVLTAGGDVYATANIVDEATQTSGTKFYAAGENGSATAEVDITADYIGPVNGGNWSVSLDRNTLVTSIVYDDVNLSSNVNLTFTPSACTVNNF